MTIPFISSSKSGPYSADGINREWAFTYSVRSKDQVVLHVYDASGNLSEVTSGLFNIAAAGLNNNSGGNVTYPISPVAPLAGGFTVFVVRKTPLAQSFAFKNQGDFFPETHEAAYDDIVRMVQDLRNASYGARLLYGTATPDDILTGDINDFYIDTDSGLIYGPKTDTGWPAGVSLVGPQGIQGPPGTGLVVQGYVPTFGDLPGGAAEGDAYVVAADSHVYFWDGDSWEDAGPIAGAIGPEGPEGPPGPQGDPGPTGPSGTFGASGTIETNVLPFTASATTLKTTIDTYAGDLNSLAGGAGGNVIIRRVATGATDAPGGSTINGSHVITHTWDANAARQFYLEHNTHRVWTRAKNAGVWGTWTRALHSEDIATDADVRSAAAATLGDNQVLRAALIESASAFVTLTDAATVAVDWDTGVNWSLTLTANRQLGNPTNEQIGVWRTILLQGNDANARTLTFAGGYIGPGAVALAGITSTNRFLLPLFPVANDVIVVGTPIGPF